MIFSGYITIVNTITANHPCEVAGYCLSDKSKSLSAFVIINKLLIPIFLNPNKSSALYSQSSPRFFIPFSYSAVSILFEISSTEIGNSNRSSIARGISCFLGPDLIIRELSSSPFTTFLNVKSIV